MLMVCRVKEGMVSYVCRPVLFQIFMSKNYLHKNALTLVLLCGNYGTYGKPKEIDITVM
jgi:hypothetical protein